MFWLATLISMFRARPSRPAADRLRLAGNFRGLRAGIVVRACPEVRKDEAPATRQRRGHLMILPSQWRRCEPGTNHISCFGVWRKGARRLAKRANRAGETRWQRPRRPHAAHEKMEAP